MRLVVLTLLLLVCSVGINAQRASDLLLGNNEKNLIVKDYNVSKKLEMAFFLSPPIMEFRYLTAKISSITPPTTFRKLNRTTFMIFVQTRTAFSG